ncbi:MULTISPECIES: WxL domain-containing protein [unclassified Enterococcus]|uniref:WxL domain-containing protein n=1 Tax=unclassified Enterococcus TaxID=2608891 RepID=UPI001CE0E4AC|nr:MULTISPECIES: WxL domain-containing protein [unclassified Enterococcus]MCA5011470.1 WxL domain-containing protein [Enterococcus sp. S23]MCA5015088.1 WxL domain-containing protein [Enterococcus sp. S22(2020)]
MKTKNIIVSTAALLLSVTAGASFTHAEESSGKTTTDAEFAAGERPDPILPEEGPKPPTTVDPGVDPLPETGNVYVTHLPNISFGNGNKIVAGGTEYEALTEEVTQNAGAIRFHIPHFVQVADLSGSSETKWSVTVQQDDIYKTTDGKSLENSRIRIYENSVRSNAYTNSEIAAGVNGVDTTSGFSMIPVATKDTTTAPLEVLSVKAAGATNNTITSSVFIKDYDETDYDAVKTPNAARYSGVKLNVPQEDQAKAQKDNKYRANLTWTLSVAP